MDQKSNRWFETDKIIKRGMETIYMAFPEEVLPDDRILSFKDRYYATYFFRKCILSSQSMNRLRSILSNPPFNDEVFQRTDHDVIDMIVDGVMEGVLCIVKMPSKWFSWEVNQALVDAMALEKERNAKRTVPEETIATLPVKPFEPKWIKFKVVDDETGEPVEMASFNTRLPDGTVQTLESGEKGEIEIGEIDQSGVCEVNEVSEDKIHVEKALLLTAVGERFLPFSKDEKRMAKPLSDEPTPVQNKGPLPIIKAKSYKVKTGETLSKISEQSGIPLSDILFFNWGTDDKKVVDRFLPHDVGCSKRLEKEGEWVFDSKDIPGIIYLPEKMAEKNIQLENSHTLRVRTPKRYLRMRYEIDISDDAVADDEILLRSDDKKWIYHIHVNMLSQIIPGWVEIVFPRPPEGKAYTLTYDLKDGDAPIVIFENMTTDDLYSMEAIHDEFIV